MACTDPQSFNQRVDAMGGAPAAHAVLVWNFRDPIHPELVLESPYEVFCFQSNPLQPEIITGGCYNGQVIMWDTASQEVACCCSCAYMLLHMLFWCMPILPCCIIQSLSAFVVTRLVCSLHQRAAM